MEWRNVLFISVASFVLCESWQFITAAVKEGNKEWQKTFLFPRKWGERGFIW